MVVRNMCMTNYLLDGGHKLIKVDRDKTNKSRLVFIFDDNEELKSYMSTYPLFERRYQYVSEQDCKNKMDKSN